MSILKVRRAPDQYNGDLSCVEAVSQHFLCSDLPILIFPGDGPAPHRSYAVIVPNSEGFASHAADLYEWYGSNGEGKLAAEKIIPRPGWELEWLPDPES